MKRCKFCAEEIQNEAIVCKHCGKEQTETAAYQAPAPVKNVNPGVAAVLQFFFPGVGFMYIGKIGYGFFQLILTLILLATVVGIPIVLIWDIASVFAVYHAAEKIMNPKPKPFEAAPVTPFEDTNKQLGGRGRLFR